MLLMMGRKMTVMMVKGSNILLLTHKTHRSSIKWQTASHLLETHLNLLTAGLQHHHPLMLSRRPPPGKRMHCSPKKDAIEDKLLQIIEKKKL